MADDVALQSFLAEKFGKLYLIPGADHLIEGVVSVKGALHAVYDEERLALFFAEGDESKIGEALDHISCNIDGLHLGNCPVVMNKRDDLWPSSR
jgi:hypothetical protein